MAAHVVAGLFGLALAAVVFVILRRAVKWTGARNIALPFYLYLISYALLVPSFVFPGSTSDCFGMAWAAVVLCSAVVAVFRLCLSKKSSKKTKRAGAVFAVGSLTLIGVFVAVPVAFGMLMPELTAHTDSNAWPSAQLTLFCRYTDSGAAGTPEFLLSVAAKYKYVFLPKTALCEAGC